MKKYLKWEFWPSWLFYIPIYAMYLWFSLRARSMVFFSAANPSMFMGGFVDYSKYDVLMKIPEQVVPKAFLLEEKEDGLAKAKEIIHSGQLSYPVILKPDRGQRGFAVSKIKNDNELEGYLKKYKTNIVLQEYANFPLEFGVLYYRYPNEERGTISSVVQKVFMEVIGDGKSTLKTLFKKDERAQYYYSFLCEYYKDDLDYVLPEGEDMILVEVGNHCKGATFMNGNHLINEQLIDTFDHISKQVDGFYFGRYDLRTATLEDLYAGNFKVVELNGANSEPAHIYDLPLMKAYGFMFKHWKTIFKIGTMNHKKGIPYMSALKAARITRNHFKRRKKEVLN